MIIHPVKQGTQDWLQLRSQCRTASEAPAMMGASKYQSRSDLLKQKATGISPEVDSFTQGLFDRGHETEAQARVITEEEIDDDLFPVTCTDDSVYLLVSLDGRSTDGRKLFEHKLWSESLAAQVRSGDLEPHYYWQLEQELLVAEAEEVIFVCSDGTSEKRVSMVYRPVPGRAEALVAGWKQFDADLAAYVPQPAAEPKPIGRTPENLPALRIEVTGMVTASNLAEYKEHALAVLGDINRELKTDQDFATAEATVKWCGDVESRLEAAKQHALSQTASIDELFRTVDEISAEARRVRLDLDKLVKARKDQIRLEIVQGGGQALFDHVASLNASLGKPYMPAISADFAGAIKGKRTIESLRNAVDTLLAAKKIEADAIGRKIQTNLNILRDLAADHKALFPDTAQIVLKAPDDLEALVKTRIAEHKAEIERQVQAEREAHERREAATRAEAERKAEAERVQAEQRAAADSARQAEEAQAAARKQQEEAERKALAEAVQVVENNGPDSLASHSPAHVGTPVYAAEAPTANVVPLARPVPVATSATPTLRLGEINTRLGHFSITADGLRALGFEIVAKDRAACLYRESDWPHMLAAMVQHLEKVQARQAA